ncbi:hypothetical protein DAPPUDRAFT_238473 [Daphnia pulex]|uniref:Uncharacterized protein n=1 Tax=Daphnia pulex TaxID=6669 RepID=E9G6H8_DAPPU|nr:hypothetical protein DAPPUDRAFT_241051 [Daphnia pulex]EFX82729.1 hypothetical protein DAPPUDRAFT_241052 [Daphnia pulex]EFX84939.1 hypothetical protein DAPPUDRAFT_238471 [Daphnia pulex]EFX84990.1 hypothetical protein DAPPUDRAFT_238473 [Daphnia pulex]|eukprot:EFX82707.1 hypothetical protein DAPPUDRAFT_241051 [Daphnia pulex]
MFNVLKDLSVNINNYTKTFPFQPDSNKLAKRNLKPKDLETMLSTTSRFQKLNNI